MTHRERRRLAIQLNLDPNEWRFVEATESYIVYGNGKKRKKFYYGGECR